MIDSRKLQSLRERYANASGGDMFDPHFASVARPSSRARTSASGPSRAFPRCSTRRVDADAQELPDFGGLDVALVGVPMDFGVTNRNGSRFGPRAVRTIERIGPYDHVLKCAPFSKARIADIGDVPMQSRYDLALCHADIEAFYRRLVRAGVRPLSVGGDHSICSSILKAVGARDSLSG